MTVHAQVMAQTMREKSRAGSSRKNRVLVTLEYTKGQKPIDDNLVRLDVEIIVDYASLEAIGGVDNHLVNNIVNIARLLSEFAVDRKCSGLYHN